MDKILKTSLVLYYDGRLRPINFLVSAIFLITSISFGFHKIVFWILEAHAPVVSNG